MKKNGTYILLSLLAIMIAIIIVSDFNATKAKKGKANPYALDISEFQKVLDFGRKDVQNKKGKTVCRFVV